MGIPNITPEAIISFSKRLNIFRANHNFLEEACGEGTEHRPETTKKTNESISFIVSLLKVLVFTASCRCSLRVILVTLRLYTWRAWGVVFTCHI
jgi:hypothetical protein